MRPIPTTTAALCALLVACGKDDPAPTPTPTPAQGQTSAPERDPAAEHKTTEPGAADPTVKDPGSQPGAGEQKDPSTADPKTPTPPTPVPAQPLVASAPAPDESALTPSSIASFPAEIVAVGGTPSLAALVQAFTSQAQRVPNAQIPPDPLPMALAMIQQKAGVDLSWLDTDKPLRFAVPDPKAYPEGVVLLLPLKAGATVDAKTIPGATEGGGHFLSVDLGGKKVFVDKTVDGHLLLTSHDDLAKKLEAFAKELAGWTPSDPLVVDTSVEHLTRIYAADLAQAKGMIDSIGSSMAQRPEMGTQMGPALEMAKTGFALVEGTQRIGLSLDPRGDFPRVALSFRGLPGGKLDGIIKELAARKIALAGAVPEDAWFAMAYDIEGATYFSDAQAVVDAITRVPMGPMPVSWSEDEKKELLALFEKAQTLQGGQGAFWARQQGSNAFIFESLSDTTDGVAMQANVLAIGELIYKKVWSEGRKAMLAQGAPADQLPENMSFKDFVGLMSKNTGALGISVGVNEAATRGGAKAGALEVKIDWSRLPLEGEAKAIADAVGNEIGLGFVGEGQRFATVIGPEAAARAARLLDAPVGEPSDSWIAKAQDHAIFALLRPARLLRTLAAFVPDLAAKKATIDALADDPIVVRGRSDGTAFYLEGTLPAKVIAGLASMQ